LLVVRDERVVSTSQVKAPQGAHYQRGEVMTANEIGPPAGTLGGNKKVTVVVWVAQLLLALFFVAAALPKLMGDPTAVAMFRLFGLGDWFRIFTGAVEIAGAVGLLIPRLCGPAAIGLGCVMVGATLANLLVFPDGAGMAIVTVLLGFCFGAIARYHWDDLKALVRVAKALVAK
jgi:putative oxidoreductase